MGEPRCCTPQLYGPVRARETDRSLMAWALTCSLGESGGLCGSFPGIEDLAYAF
jgi:hypothetical protein